MFAQKYKLTMDTSCLHFCLMQKNAAERLKMALEKKQISSHFLAKSASLSPSLVSQIILGKRKMSYESAEKLAEVLGVPAIWLYKGEGEMESEGKQPSEEPAPQPQPETKTVSVTTTDEADPDADSIEPPESLPMYGNLPGWKEAEKQAKATISLPSWVWAQARRACGVMSPQLPVTQAFVVSIAKGIYELTDPTEAMIRTNRELEKQLEALRKRYAKRK
jgi:transcriptional regulator with XRE-family HTH domain